MFTNVNINPISPASGPAAGQPGDKFPASHKVQDAEVTKLLHPTDTGHGLFVLKCHGPVSQSRCIKSVMLNVCTD